MAVVDQPRTDLSSVRLKIFYPSHSGPRVASVRGRLDLRYSKEHAMHFRTLTPAAILRQAATRITLDQRPIVAAKASDQGREANRFGKAFPPEDFGGFVSSWCRGDTQIAEQIGAAPMVRMNAQL